MQTVFCRYGCSDCSFTIEHGKHAQPFRSVQTRLESVLYGSSFCVTDIGISAVMTAGALIHRTATLPHVVGAN